MERSVPERYSGNLRKALDVAIESSGVKTPQDLSLFAMLHGLAKLVESEAAQALSSMSVDLEALKNDTRTMLEGGETQPGEHCAGRWALEKAEKESGLMGDPHVGTEHLLLALTDEGFGDFGLLLAKHGISWISVHRAVADLRKVSPISAANLDQPGARSASMQAAMATAILAKAEAEHGTKPESQDPSPQASAPPKVGPLIRPQRAPTPVPIAARPAPAPAARTPAKRVEMPEPPPSAAASALPPPPPPPPPSTPPPTPQATPVGGSPAWARPSGAGSAGSVVSKSAAEPVGHYPHARRVGNLLFLSGVGPRERGSKSIPGVMLDAGGNVIAHDIEAQVRACFANVRAVLEEAGSSWDRIVDVTVFLTDMRGDFATFNRLWAELFPTDPPCRTTVEIRSLPTPIAFEVKVIATVG